MKILDKYLYGSRLYGTHREDSDFDYIAIVLDYPETGSLYEKDNKTYHLYSFKDHIKGMENHDVAIIESMYLNNKVPDFFKLNKSKLRDSFSTVSNHSWVKGKKKLTVHFDYDKLSGIKSIFHSIRITDYGIQLADQGRIYKKDRYNFIMKELYELAEKYEREELWTIIESRYKKLWKDLRHEFKMLAPKSSSEKSSNKQKLIQTFKINNINPSKKLIKEILEVFE